MEMSLQFFELLKQSFMFMIIFMRNMVLFDNFIEIITLRFWCLIYFLKAVYYTVEVHNFDLQEKTIKNNNNTITAKWVKPKIVIELTNCKM